METFDLSELRYMVQTAQPPCISVCMPTNVTGVAAEQDRVRLKNLAVQVGKELEGWLRNVDARPLVAGILQIPNDQDFWTKRQSGLAVFVDQQSFRRFSVPFPLVEQAVVGKRFEIKPLLPLLASSQRFFVLALSQRKVRLFQATEYQIEEIQINELPQRIEESLNLSGSDRGSQAHFAMKAGHGRQTLVFHGQGGEKDTHKEELLQFFRLIDKALQSQLQDQFAPLVLAGVDYLLPLFREISQYRRIAEIELTGNFDALNPQQIHQNVWPLIQPQLKEKQQRAVDKYQRLAGTGLASDDLSQVLPAAFDGRIETLLIDPLRYHWGVCGPQGREVVVRDIRLPGDADLPGWAATETLMHGGQIYTVDSDELAMSHGVAAVMRY
jgi:hypothetical protein